MALMGRKWAHRQPMVFGGISQRRWHCCPQLLANGLLRSRRWRFGRDYRAWRATEKLLRGTSLSVQLVRGDYSIAASGTVTFRDGDRIYAFGHPFLSLGAAICLSRNVGSDGLPTLTTRLSFQCRAR